VSIAIILVAVVIIGGVVVVAMGGGGELVRDLPDEPADTDFQAPADVARYRPPAALLGYHAGATERALQHIARVLADRDAEIDWLRSRLEQAEPGGEHPDGNRTGSTGPEVPHQLGSQQAVPPHSVPRQPVPEQTVADQPAHEREQEPVTAADPLAQPSQATSVRDDR